MRYVFILLIVLVVFALVDCIQYRDDEMPSGVPKPVWVVLILLLPGAGAIAWLVVSRLTRRARREGRPTGPRPGRPTRPPRRRPAPRPVAPDDDPDFLASLDPRRQAPEPEVPEVPETGPGDDGRDDGTPGNAPGGADEDDTPHR